MDFWVTSYTYRCGFFHLTNGAPDLKSAGQLNNTTGLLTTYLSIPRPQPADPNAPAPDTSPAFHLSKDSACHASMQLHSNNTACTRTPTKYVGAVVVGLPPVGTACCTLRSQAVFLAQTSSVKSALSRPSHQQVPREDHTGRAAHR